MKAILLFTVLVCSNALASTSGLRRGLRTLASCILPSPPSTEPSPVDEFLHICQSHRYLACQKSARVLLEESTGEFARELLRNAIDKENAWAVSALLDVGQFEPDFYLELFENFFKEGENNLVFEALARKCKEIDPVGSDLVTRKYQNKRELYSLARNIMALRARPNIVPEDQFASNLVVAIKNSIAVGDHKFVYEYSRYFTPRALRQANILSHASKHGDQFMVFYATKDVNALDSSIDEALKAAENPAEVPFSRPVRIPKSAVMPIPYKDTKDVVEYLKEIIAKRG